MRVLPPFSPTPRARQTPTDVVIEMLGADLWKDFDIVEALVAHHSRRHPITTRTHQLIEQTRTDP
jgi:hypothetical protein